MDIAHYLAMMKLCDEIRGVLLRRCIGLIEALKAVAETVQHGVYELFQHGTMGLLVGEIRPGSAAGSLLLQPIEQKLDWDSSPRFGARRLCRVELKQTRIGLIAPHFETVACLLGVIFFDCKSLHRRKDFFNKGFSLPCWALAQPGPMVHALVSRNRV
jgi:hypothetical protein